jgi:hypothetical protein
MNIFTRKCLSTRRFLFRLGRYACSFPLAMILAGCAATRQANVAPVPGGAEKANGFMYFVDSQNGNDRNNGLSAAAAWKSLDMVNHKTFSAGDKILFKAGSVWKGQLKPQDSGTPENPIRIDQYGNKEAVGSYKGLPRIDAEGLFDTALYLHNVQGWEVRHLELTNKGPKDKPRRSGATVQILDFGTAKHIVLDGLYIHDVNGSLEKDKGGGQGIFLSNGGETVKSRFDGLVIKNCLIQRTQRNGIIQDGYWTRDKWYPNLNVVFRSNLLEEVPGDGIVPIGCDGALIEYNRMRNCPPLLPKDQWAAGIWPWSCDNTIIQYNEVSDHKSPGDAQGFDSDWNCRNTIIQYNFSHDNDGGFLLICDFGKKKMPENIGTTGTIVRYNLSINDGIRSKPTPGGYFSPTIRFNGPCKDTQIYNNTIIVPKKASAKMDRNILDMGDWEGSGWPENTFFRNNIFYVEDTADYKPGKGINTVFENNLYYGARNNRPADEKAILADPKFAKLVMSVGPRGALSNKGFSDDPFIRQFRLRKDSPCIGKGMMIEDNGGQDILGRPLVKKSCTVGAIE